MLNPDYDMDKYPLSKELDDLDKAMTRQEQDRSTDTERIEGMANQLTALRVRLDREGRLSELDRNDMEDAEAAIRALQVRVKRLRNMYDRLIAAAPASVAERLYQLSGPSAVKADIAASIRALQAQVELLTQERGTDTGHVCVYCNLPIFGKMIGAGDGTGQRFADPECYYRRRAETAERALEEARADSEDDNG